MLPGAVSACSKIDVSANNYFFKPLLAVHRKRIIHSHDNVRDCRGGRQLRLDAHQHIPNTGSMPVHHEHWFNASASQTLVQWQCIPNTGSMPVHPEHWFNASAPRTLVQCQCIPNTGSMPVHPEHWFNVSTSRTLVQCQCITNTLTHQEHWFNASTS